MKTLSGSSLTFLLFVSACADTTYEKQPGKINPDFQKYVLKFEQNINIAVDLDIDYNKLAYPIIGTCYVYTDGYRNIDIDPDAWNEAEDLKKEELIFHELGHCVLNRDHDNTMLEYNGDELPKSIMYPYVFEYEYGEYQDYYWAELKNENAVLTDYVD